MVSTRIGAEGLSFVDGTGILLCDDNAGFASACLRLLEGDALCRRLGLTARARVRASYDVASIER